MEVINTLTHCRTLTLSQAFNTFIDDVFAFIIVMPTAHRIAVFRDDLVFVIYLYQRWCVCVCVCLRGIRTVLGWVMVGLSSAHQLS